MTTPAPFIGESGEHVDLSPRFFYSATVAASPAAGSETIIATLTVGSALFVGKAVRLSGWCAFTVGTSGVSATLKLRQTDTSGSTKASTGARTVTAGNLYIEQAFGVDTAPTLPGQVYVLTLTIGSGAATSTVSAVYLEALVI